MLVRRCPVLTPASLAARRANALKSTGPRTVRGKARVSLNALRHGRSAVPFTLLRERLLRAGHRRQEELYSHLHSRITQAFGAQNLHARQAADRMATTVWCLATGRTSSRTKLESRLNSRTGTLRLPSDQQMVRLRFKVQDEWRRIGLVFWVQRKKYRTVARLLRVLLGVESVARPEPDPGLETRVRSRIFRLRRPRPLERARFALDPNGNPDWSREPWRSLAEPATAARGPQAEEAALLPSGAASPRASAGQAEAGITIGVTSSAAEASRHAETASNAGSAAPARSVPRRVAAGPEHFNAAAAAALGAQLPGPDASPARRIRGAASQVVAGISRLLSSHLERP